MKARHIVLLAACAASAQVAAAPADACTAAALAPALGTVDGESATLDAATWSAGGDGLPAHCIVTGTIGAHAGAPDATRYGNQFRLRIPQQWNGRLVFQGGGGNNGSVGDALGTLKDGSKSLAQGYAVVAQDSGHQGRDPRFALDREAYLDFAHEGVHQVTLASKSLLKNFTGRAPEYAYFVGCSNGGREALVTAQRHADFDGVVSGNAGMAVYDQWVHNMSVLRMASRVAGVPEGTTPTDTSGAFRDEQLAYAAGHFMQKCDRLDGAVDGLMSNVAACRSTPEDIRALQCRADGGASTDARCLSRVQAGGLAELYDGLRDRKGELVHPGFYPGSIEHGMRETYLGVAGSDFPLGSFYKSIMPNFYYMGYGFRGYPGVTGPADEVASYPASSVGYVARFDVEKEPAKLAQGRLDFHGANVDPARPGPNFEAFYRRGGKMLIYTGSADPAVQARAIVGLVERIGRQYGAGAANMARLFMVPGMAHCRGGATADQFDQLAPLAAWVERGVAPERIEARALPGSALDPDGKGVSRPLCAWPRYARYQGGPVNEAASHACVAPD
ncbi:tannase/feruloyl esterase family alpha/beta hydrolase [Massilia niastensis]|uniref:tannase/feruloyl esterase family alpha/beta hydrolase n=1 Tax=Massilia niastensis TaxID=544911 RepID=UPI0003807A9D|nr:tannase/feruloyl esterase family alpha/beta hydrolase [Massilia niastensis]